MLTFHHGGDPVSTWVATPEGHAEDITHLIKHVVKQILAKNDKLFAFDANSVNDSIFASGEDAVAVA